MLPAILSLTALPALCSALSSAQVYLYPPLPFSAQSAGPALLAHHLGLEAFESLPLEASTGEIVFGGSNSFVGEGRRDTLLVSIDASHPDDVMPESFQSSFILPTTSDSTLPILQLYARLAHNTYRSVVDSSTKPTSQPSLRFLDIFSLSSSSSATKSAALEAFLTGLSKIVAFVEESEGQQTAERFGALEVNGLSDIEEEWGRESEQYLTAAATLKATVQSAISNGLSLAVLFPSHLDTRQVVQPPQSPFPAPQIPDTAPVFSTSTCFTTADACRNATASCSSRGNCVGATRAGRTCFVCQCVKAPLQEDGKNISWAGEMCQKKDISQEFTLILGTVIFLILITIGSISLLYTIGDQELPGTLTGGLGGGHLKRE